MKVKFQSTLLAIVAIAAISSFFGARVNDVVRPLSTTRVDDLEILGDTDGSGVITARSGVRLTTPTTGPILLSGSGDPNGSVSATQGSMYLRTSNATIYTNTNGVTAWTQVGAGSSVSPSVVWSDADASGTTNLSTLGTIDWYYFTPALTFPTAAADIHAKLTGGYILETLRWKNVGAAATNGSGFNFSTTASDDLFGAALSTNTQYGVSLAFGSVPATGMGFRFRVPATTTTRVLRIYIRGMGCSNNTGSRVLTATLKKAGTTATIGPSSGSSSPIPDRIWKVTYNSSSDDDLVVTVTLLNTGAFIGTCDVYAQGISLGAS